MKKLTRVLSVVMAIAMLFTMSMSASAATYTDVTTEDSYYEAVEALSALGVVKGYEAGDFQPEGKITRAEAAAIIMRIMGMAAVENTRINTQFTDVTSEHWASGVISAAADSAIVNGMGDGTFAPSAEVTYDQVVKMLVCAMGYEPKAKTVVAAGTNVFPTGYNIVANQLRITEGALKTEGGATRATVARLVYNALTKPLMEQYTFGTEETIGERTNKSILYTKLNAVEIEAKINKLNLNPEETIVELSTSKVDKVAENNAFIPSDFNKIRKGNAELVGLQGLTVKALVDISDRYNPVLLVVFPQAGRNDELAIDPTLFVGFYDDDTTTYTDNIRYYKDADSTVLNVSSKIEATDETPFAAYINMTPINFTDNTDVAKVAKEINDKIGKGKITDIAETNHKAYRFVDTNNNGKYDTLFIDNSASFVVGKINAANYQISKATEGVYNSDKDCDGSDSVYSFKPLYLDKEDGDVDYAIKDSEGNELAFEDIKVGDILTVAYSTDGSYKFYDITVSSASAVEGTITEVRTEDVKYGGTITYYVIDGTAYRVNGVATAGKDLDAGSAGTFNITADGAIISFEAVASAKNYGVVIASAAKSAISFDPGVQVQMMTQDGTIKTFDYAPTVSFFDGVSTVTQTDLQSNLTAITSTKFDIAAGTIVIYETNSDGEIRRIHTSADAIKEKDDTTLVEIDASGDKKAPYAALTGKIDGKFFTENSVIVAIDAWGSRDKKDKYSLVSLDALTDETEYAGWLVADSEKEVKFAYITNLAVKPALNAVPMIITGTSTTNVDGETRKKYTGLIDGQEVSYVMAEEVTYVSMNNEVVTSVDAKVVPADVLDTDGVTVLTPAATVAAAAKGAFAIGKNDVIQVVLNANEEIVSYRHLLKWDNNEYYAMISASYNEDDKAAASAVFTKLSDMSAVNASYAVANLVGSSVADRPNKITSKVVEFDSKGDQAYDDDVTTYIFGKNYTKAKVSSVDSAELISDYEVADQAKADDIVYLYSFDGENVFSFIYDVASDNK